MGQRQLAARLRASAGTVAEARPRWRPRSTPPTCCSSPAPTRTGRHYPHGSAWRVWASSRPSARARYAKLAQLVIAGRLTSEVAAVYPLEQVSAALHHASQQGRDGKIVLRIS
jgi:hypothetical protein